MWICVPCVWLVKLHNLRCVIFKSEVLFKHEGEQMQWGGGTCHPYPTQHGSCAENTVKRLPPSIRMALMNLRREKQSFPVGFSALHFAARTEGTSYILAGPPPPFLAAQWLCGFTWVAVLTLKYWKCDVCQSNPIREYRNTPIWYNRVITIRVTVILYSELMG